MKRFFLACCVSYNEASNTTWRPTPVRKCPCVSRAMLDIQREPAPKAEAAPEPLQLPLLVPEHAPETDAPPVTAELMEALYRVLLHNDDVTPFDYVMNMLGMLFGLSSEISEHVAMTAHTEGIAVVIIRPRSEAERLSGSAKRIARADGYPLTFSVEPEV